MKYMNFQEYLDRNKKLQTSAPVKKIADFEGKVDTKPAKEKKHKDAGGKGQEGEIKPYKGGTDAKDPNKGKLGDGFADKGDKKLKYEPETLADKSKSEEGVHGGKKQPSWPKTKTQEWVDRTKNMSLAEFTKSIRSEALKGLDECGCQEAPHSSIKDTVSICKCNKKNVSAFVREMKRNGLFGSLVKEMASHPEMFKALAILMERDEVYARKLAKAMNEMVAPPVGDDGGMSGPPMKKKKPMPHPDDMGGEGDDMGMGDKDGDMSDLGDDDGDMGMDGDDDMGMGDEDGDMSDMGDDDGDDLDGLDNPAPHNDKIGKIAPPKKKSAHHNLLAAMKDQPSLGM